MSDSSYSVDSDSDKETTKVKAPPVTYKKLSTSQATQQRTSLSTQKSERSLARGSQQQRQQKEPNISQARGNIPISRRTATQHETERGRGNASRTKYVANKGLNDAGRARGGAPQPMTAPPRQHRQGQSLSLANTRGQLGVNSKPDRASVPRRIDKWLEQPVATCLVFDLCAAATDLSIYLKTTAEVPPDTISRLISLLHRAVNTNQKEAVDRIIRCVLDAYLLDGHFILFLDRQLRDKSLRPDTLQSLHQMLDVVEYAIGNCPEHGAKCNYSLQQIVEKGKQLALMTPDTRLMHQATELINLSTASKVGQDQEPFQYHHTGSDSGSTPRERKPRVEPDHDESLPPDDFRGISIFPDTDEIFDEVAPFLRANKTSGAYRDLRHYLDVHSRLLKEDYLEPIRHGLKDFKVAQESGTKVKEDNLRFYYNVKLIQMKCDDNRGITHFIQFSLNTRIPIDWEQSRRLLFGSLLVLSKDKFKTTVFATVSDRNSSMLEKGIVEVTFQNNLEQIFTSSEFDLFLMAETTAYFESYRHVLEGLQEMKKLPLERYFLSVEKIIYPPAYYIESPEIDISCIASQGKCLAPVEVLDEDDWPEACDTILNESQMDALKLALTKEVAIIQGPPGTGKTYVGLKIMNILFKHMTRMGTRKAPILVVCYTNHALDQFLEGMLKFCDSGIVRVGGRSSSEALQRFNLREIRKDPKIERNFKIQTQNLRKCKDSLKTVAKYVNTYWQQSLKQETSILSLEDLSEEIDSTHQHSLEDPQRHSGWNPKVMRVWLKASSANMENHMTKAAIRRLAQVITSGENGMHDSAIKNVFAAARADFMTRVQIYRYWAGIHKMRLESQLDHAMAFATGDDATLQRLLQEQDLAVEDILPDEKLIPLMGSEEIFSYIKESVELGSKGFDTSKQTVVRQWLLQEFQSVDAVLDAIERLTDPKVLGTHRGKKPKSRDIDTEDDLDDSGFRRRHWILDDTSDEEDDDEDGDSDDSSHSRGRSSSGGMEDIDDFDEGKNIKKSQFRDLSRDFEQFQNREIQIYQRAQMLGVDMADEDPEDQEGEWQDGNHLTHSRVFKLLHSVDPFTEDEANAIKDVWSLDLRDRYRLYKYWINLRKDKLTHRLIDLTKEYRMILAQKKEALNMKDVAILRSSRVIGMTTSGAAKHRAVLQKVGSQIVVVEEAAEVLEAHIITALNAQVKHLILIGDHQQLRPNPTVYRLAKDYDLEISLFERLVNNDIPCVMLEEQHRMRPEISQFVRHIYPRLQDHGTVRFYGNIEGVASDVFFLQHSMEETGVDDTSSKANKHEAHFLTALCKYFLQHGYEGFQITILAAYGGQVDAIKEAMEPEESMYEHVRVTSIDNYQGEENDIILLSLVRSNKENNVGFLKIHNRVCVALSRAKKGLFVIGNMKQLAYSSPLWKKILKTANEKRMTGVSLKLVCVNHNENITHVRSREDFQRNVPEGGCSLPCGIKLECGHTCNLTCHSWDRLHQETKCRQPCLRSCPEGHPCSLTCADECGPCQVLVKRVLRDCNHEDTVPCYKDVNEHLCKQPCKKLLPCGHECRGACGECSTNGKHAPCLEKVEKTWPICGHKNMTECYKDPTVEPCTTRCKEILQCGHKCKGTCGGCLNSRVHLPCRSDCGKPLPCGHPCKGSCGGVCLPCGMKCPTRCRHGPCPKTTCGALCPPCLENCKMTCSHSSCTRRCLDECLSRPCTKVCGKPAEKCKHKCVSLCGEKCVCFICGKENFQLLDTSTSRKIQPKYVMAHEQRERAKKFELDPQTVLMKIPSCGHVFTLNQLDKYMESINPKDTSFIKCPSPSCPAFIQGIRRYDNINKQRADRRHARKEKLIEDTKVSFPQLSQVRLSLAKVRAYCHIDEVEYLHSKNIDELIDPNEVQAFTSLARFAYTLLQIEHIDHKFNKQRIFNASRWKQLILNAKKSITPQFQEEMRLELHRLLLSQQLIILYQLLKDTYTEIDGTTKSIIFNLKSSFKEKMTETSMKTSETSMEMLFKKLLDRDEDDYWHQLAIKLKSRSLLVCACLDEPYDQHLASILERYQIDDSSDQEEEEEESDSENEGSTEIDGSSEDEQYSEIDFQD